MPAKIMKWVSIAALLTTALFWRLAANYQLLLGFVVFLGAIVVVRQAIQARKYLWSAAFVAIAVLFNLLVLVLKPSGNLSLLMDLVCIAPFVISLSASKTHHSLLSIPSITARSRE